MGQGQGENPFAGLGAAVLLDIGGDIGALVVEMPSSMIDEEIEVRPVGGADHEHHESGVPHDHEHDQHHGHGHHPHVAVVARTAGGRTVPSLVFGELREGTYELYAKGGGPVRLTAAVRGGEVTELAWPHDG